MVEKKGFSDLLCSGNNMKRILFLVIWSIGVSISTLLIFGLIWHFSKPFKCSKAKIVSITVDQKTGDKYGLGAGGGVYRYLGECWVIQK